MNSTQVYSSKAEKYGRYRWSYAPEAIQTILDRTGITTDSVVADIGAGTGILTREFIGKVKCIFAIEPNPEMRAISAKEFAQYPSCKIIDGQAEATTLANQSIDLITAAQAIHWFEPQKAKQEFERILKPGSWLAICCNYGTDHKLGTALQDVYPSENTRETIRARRNQPISYYFNDGEFLKQEYPFKLQATWKEFFGGLSTASFAPDDDSPLYAEFEQAAKYVFKRFSTDGLIAQHGVTELYLGKI